MSSAYDKYYQTANLFGEPFRELIDFFDSYSKKGKVLDLGCGQGRDSLAIARLGYPVTAVDNSKVGIEQMQKISLIEDLNLVGQVRDIYAFDGFEAFDFVLLDSMFHFTKKDKDKEINLIKTIISKIKKGCLLIVCIQDTGKKVQILNETIDFKNQLKRIADKKLKYTYEDKESGNKSEVDYRMIIVEK